MTQLSLTDYRQPEPLRLLGRYEREPLEQAWIDYDQRHPETWRLFERFTLELVRAGRKHYSADAVVHRIRWHAAIEYGDEDFKVNNNHVRFMAERWARLHPAHADFYRRRERRA